MQITIIEIKNHEKYLISLSDLKKYYFLKI